MATPARFANALYQRPWLPQIGTYPGRTGNALTDLAAAPPGAPAVPQVQEPPVYAGSQPLQSRVEAPGEGYGGGGIDPNTSGYGTASSLGAFLGNIATGLGLITGPLGAAITGGRILGTMIADPQRDTFYGVGDLFGGGGGPNVDQGAVIGAPAGTAPGWGGTIGRTAEGSIEFGPATPDVNDVLSATPNPGNPFGMAQTHGTVSYGGGGDGGGGYGGGLGASSDATMGGVGQEAGQSLGWRRGGYTGAGADRMVQPGMPAGMVHEGEYVLPARATGHYGTSLLTQLKNRKIDKDKLARLARR